MKNLTTWGAAAILILLMAVNVAAAEDARVEKPDFDIRGVTLCVMSWPDYRATFSREKYPWFFDRVEMGRFLDAVAAARMNTIFLWSSHLFPYILDMPEYPQAHELSREELLRNREQFRWFTRECTRRDIRVLLHFYNIHISPGLAEAHNISTRPEKPTPFLKQYTHYALDRFFAEYDSVGLYICPGESLQSQYQLEWFRDVIFDAARKSGKNPLLVIRDWTLNMEFRAQLKSLYANLYSELKHNDESLTSPQPDLRHEQWRGLTRGHVVNLHGPPMDLQPMRWGSPLFIEETVQAWKSLGFVKGAEIYGLVFWQWPYTLDKLEPRQQGYHPPGRKLLSIDRDSIYLDAFGRYLWRSNRDPREERKYWENYLARKFASEEAGRQLYRWYVLTGPISPGIQNLTAVRFGNFWPTVMLQMQEIDDILKARKRIEDTPLTLSRETGRTNQLYYSRPVDEYFFERYKKRYNMSRLSRKISMPVSQYAKELCAGREVEDAMTPDKVCDLLCLLAEESLGAAQSALAAATEPAAREELKRFVTDSQMYILAAEVFRHKVTAALLKAQMLSDGNRNLAEPFRRHMEATVADYERLAALTDKTYLFGNDLMATHWQTILPLSIKKDLAVQIEWLEKFLAQPADNIFSKERVIQLMHKVNDYQATHPWKKHDRDWVRATYYTGVIALYETTADPRILDQALNWAKKHQWEVGKESLRFPANKMTCGQTWLKLYFNKREPERITKMQTYVDEQIAKSEPPRVGWFYSDALYVGPPTLAMLGKATGEHKYYDYLNRVFWDTTERLLDKQDGLFYRDRRYIDVKTAKGKKIFWSRGNGWVIAGIPRVLEYLPEDNFFYDRYVELLRTMAAALAERQGADGLWRANLADPDQYPGPETSGSAFFCYAMAWGINHAKLDREKYLPVVRKAWQGLVQSVGCDGKLGYVQGEAYEPGPAARDDTHEYATGAFLLAGSQMVGLVESTDNANQKTVSISQNATK